MQFFSDNLTDIFKLNIRWIYSPLADFIRDFGAGTFIFLAGISSRLSHNNYIRALKTLICALILSIVTYFYMPDEFIFMGVLHFMGVMMLMYALFGRFLEKINPKALFIVNIILFVSYSVMNIV